MRDLRDYKILSAPLQTLSADMVEHAGSGHPGAAIGMSDVMAVLAADFLKFSPQSPRWAQRDRIIFSAGHISALLYSFYYLAGYKDFTQQDIKNFRQLDSICAGHPEYGLHPAIEATTGPLGQGIGMAVGMAIALKKRYGAASPKIYVICGDGCLMEGVSYEASSIAGHLGLDNLILLFDDNQISIDGSTSLAISEDIQARFTSQGWQAQKIDGHDYAQIHHALSNAQNAGCPSIISCRTVIARGAGKKAGSEKSHGSPLGAELVLQLKKNLGAPQGYFAVDPKALQLWHSLGIDNIDQRQYKAEEIKIDIDAVLARCKGDQSTRAISGYVIESLQSDNIVFGSADLSLSNNIKSGAAQPITRSDFSGNFIHYGVREHAMAAIMNGLALCGFKACGGTFLVFSDYMRPALRLACIMNLPVIYVMTHDSIGVGEDGPTHQPVEHLSSLRAMPGLTALRPGSAAEVAACWQIALNSNSPCLLSLTRQKIPPVDTRCDVEKGAYIARQWRGKNKKRIKIFASGSELPVGFELAQKINQNHDVSVELISVVSFEIFFKQSQEYIDLILGARAGDLKIGIEAASSFGWEKIIGETGLFFGINSYGASAPASDLYKKFGLTAAAIYKALNTRLAD